MPFSRRRKSKGKRSKSVRRRKVRSSRPSSPRRRSTRYRSTDTFVFEQGISELVRNQVLNSLESNPEDSVNIGLRHNLHITRSGGTYHIRQNQANTPPSNTPPTPGTQGRPTPGTEERIRPPTPGTEKRRRPPTPGTEDRGQV